MADPPDKRKTSWTELASLALGFPLGLYVGERFWTSPWDHGIGGALGCAIGFGMGSLIEGKVGLATLVDMVKVAAVVGAGVTAFRYVEIAWS